MTIETLISTMHQADHSLLEKMNINTNAVVINQCNVDNREKFTYKGKNVLWINTTERGLSKSRNMAIKNSTADICLISDDDMVYRNNYSETILSVFKKQKDTSIIRFEIKGIEKKYKCYPDEKQKIGYIRAMHVSSVEIAFKRDDIIDSGVMFDELIGAGTKYLMGEENAFLFECLRNKLKIQFVPEVIADLHLGNSTWFSGYNREYFIAKGAAFSAMDTNFTFALILQWAVRKYKLYKDKISLITAITLMNRGKKEYRKDVKLCNCNLISCKKGKKA